MKIPEFNRADDFLGYADIPCLLAKVKNSDLPGVAFRHIAECEEDPICEIYLRGRKPDKISPWQQEVLTQLFEKDGLAAAVAEAMKEYETNPKWAGEGCVHLAEEDRQRIKEHGIAPYITISVIVIDEVRRKVILRADTVIDGNLDEHGISIFLSKERWRFEYAEYFDRYQSGLGVDSEEKRREFTKEQWELLFPASELGTPAETDSELLVGKWEMDEPASVKLMNKLRVDSFQAHNLLRERYNIGLVISREMMRQFDLSPPIADWMRSRFRILKIERRGNRFAVHLRHLQRKGAEYVDYEDALTRDADFWCDGNILIESSGIIYRRTDQSPVENPPEQTPEYIREIYGLPQPLESMEEISKEYGQQSPRHE